MRDYSLSYFSTWKIFILYVVLSNFLIIASESQSDLKLITKENFDKELSQLDNECVLILFYDSSSTTCRKCEQWELNIKQAIETLKEEKNKISTEGEILPEIKFLKIDGYMFYNILDDFSVETFPTVKLIYKKFNLDKDITKEFYPTSISSSKIIKYLKKKLLKSWRKAESIEELNLNNPINLLIGDTQSLRESNNKNYTEFIEVIVSRYEDVNVLHGDLEQTKDFIDHLNHTDYKINSKPMIILFKKFDERSANFFDFYDELNRVNFLDFMETFAKPLVSDLDRETISYCFDPSLSIHMKSDNDKEVTLTNSREKNIFVYVYKNEQEVNSVRDSDVNYYDFYNSTNFVENFYYIFYQNAKQNTRGRKNFNQTHTKNIFYKLHNVEETGQIISDLFDLEENDLPKVVALKLTFDEQNSKLIKKYKMKENISSLSVDNFINSVEIDSYPEFLKSEYLNFSESSISRGINVIKLVSENFEKEISSANCYLVFPFKSNRIGENILELFEKVLRKHENMEIEKNEPEKDSGKRLKLGIINLSLNEIKRNLEPNFLYMFYKNKLEIFDDNKEFSVENIFKFLNDDKFNSDCLGMKYLTEEEFSFTPKDKEILHRENLYFEEIYEYLEYEFPNNETIEKQLEMINKIYDNNNGKEFELELENNLKNISNEIKNNKMEKIKEEAISDNVNKMKTDF